jgi:hypothetical protein
MLTSIGLKAQENQARGIDGKSLTAIVRHCSDSMI